jgi:hypothetical protein
VTCDKPLPLPATRRGGQLLCTCVCVWHRHISLCGHRKRRRELHYSRERGIHQQQGCQGEGQRAVHVSAGGSAAFAACGAAAAILTRDIAAGACTSAPRREAWLWCRCVHRSCLSSCCAHADNSIIVTVHANLARRALHMRVTGSPLTPPLPPLPPFLSSSASAFLCRRRSTDASLSPTKELPSKTSSLWRLRGAAGRPTPACCHSSPQW